MKHIIRLISWASLVLVITASIGCTSTYYTTKLVSGNEILYKVVDGNEHAIYKIDKNGKTTIYDHNDPKAKELAIRNKRYTQAKADRNKPKLRQSTRPETEPKLTFEDPIYVAMVQTDVGSRIRQTEKHDGAVFSSIRKELESDDVINLINQRQVNKYYNYRNRKKSKKNRLNEDVRVYTTIRLKDQSAKSKETQRFVTTTYVHLTARIESIYSKKVYNVKSTTDIYRNVQAIEELGAKIAHVIKNKIAPNIPKNRHRYR